MQTIVLVVEGDAALAELIREVLVGELYCAVVWARDCSRALALLQHEVRPHCILLDLTYPYTESFDFCTQLQRDPVTATVPLVVLVDQAEDPQILAREFTTILPKPFDLTALLAVVTPFLRSGVPPPADP